MSHPIEIRRVYPFPEGEGAGVAGVTLTYGPVVIRAVLYEKDGRRWLGMPGRRSRDDRWFEAVTIEDFNLQRQAEEMAIAAYEQVTTPATAG